MLQARITLVALLSGLMVLLQGCSDGGGGGSIGTCTPGSGANVTISGTATYDRVHHDASGGLDYNNITREPVRGAVVEAVCNSVISSTSTDSAGQYSLTIPANTENVFIRVKSQMLRTGTPSWNYSVVDNSRSQAIYSMTGSLFNAGADNSIRNLHAASGWTGTSYNQTRVAAPFAILDSVYDAHQTILAEEPGGIFPALNINWHSENTDGTYYDGNEIFILGKANNDTDEYDFHVIIHEWGHYFQDKFSRDDSIGGPHSGGDVLDIRLAFSEGFGNAFSAIVSGDPDYADSIGPDQSGFNSFTFDLENNNCPNDGWFSECSVQSILYDLYDANIDINDGVQLGFAPMYDVLKTSMPDSPAFTSIFSFIKPLKDHPDTTASFIDTLVAGQDIDQINDVYGDSETTNDPGVTDKLPVYESSIGTGINLCSTGEHQGYNGLGVYRFVRVTGSGSITFNANRTSGVNPSDPDLELFLKGERLATAWSITQNSESLTYTLQAGQTYILQVNEDTYFNVNYTGSGETCFDITM